MFSIFIFKNIKLIVAKTITKKESANDNEHFFCHNINNKICIFNFALSKKLLIIKTTTSLLTVIIASSEVICTSFSEFSGIISNFHSEATITIIF